MFNSLLGSLRNAVLKVSKLNSDPDLITTIAGAIPLVLRLGMTFGAPISQTQWETVSGLCVLVVGYYTAKSDQTTL